MQIGRIDGCTRVIGKAQGYLGLPLRDETFDCPVNGRGTPRMVTAWLPTPDEIAAINAGAPIHLTVLGSVHPPVMLGVGVAPAPTADDVMAFVVARCRRDDRARISLPDLYSAYGAWCRAAGIYRRSIFGFAAGLREHGFESRRGPGHIEWVGLALKDEAAP